MKNISFNRKPSLIICINDTDLQQTIIDFTDSTNYSSVYLSSFSELTEDIQSKNSMSVLLEFTDGKSSNFYFLNQIRNKFPHIDIIVVYSFNDEDAESKNFKLKVLENGATDCIKYPDEINFLKIRLNNSYARQLSLLEFNTNLEFWNTVNKAVKSIIKDLYGSSFFKRLLKQTINITKSDFGSIVMLEENIPAYSLAWDGNGWIEENFPEINYSSKIYDLQLNDYCIFMEDDDLLNQSNLPFVFKQFTHRSYLNFPIYNKDKNIIGFLELYKTSSKFDAGLHTALIKIILESLPFEKIKWKGDLKDKPQVKVRYDDSYLSIVDYTPLPIFIIKNEIISFANRAAAKILGYKKKELANLNFKELSPVDLTKNKLNDNDSDPNAIGRIAIKLNKKNGDTVSLQGNMNFINYMNGNAVLLICDEPLSPKSEIDATSNEKSRSSEILRLAAAVNSLKSAVTITDLNRNIVYVNPAHKSTFGYESDELIGNQSSILFSIKDPSGISEKIYDAIVAVGWEGERISIRKNGEVFPSYEKISVVKDHNGNSIGIVSIIDEITERKRLEQALRESEERYRTLVETASTAIIALNENGKIILYNPSAEKIFLYSKTDATNKTLSSLIDSIGNQVSDLDNLIGTTVELSGINKQGERFPIEVTFSKCTIEGKIIYTAIILNITERKNLQNQLIQSAKLAAVGELISGVTHEVNNPLAVVMGYAELLLEEGFENKDTEKAIKVIYSESERARKVIQNMLSFARQHTPEKEPVNLNELIETTLELAEFDLKKNSINVFKNFEGNLPEILGEPNQLKQVFLNLIINAQQAISDNSEKGNITIETISDKNISSDEDNGSIKVILSDDGPGIPKEIINKIFDPFFTTKPEGKGTGLGLSVSLGIIKDHSGNIEVKSTGDTGTSFHIQFPVLQNN